LATPLVAGVENASIFFQFVFDTIPDYRKELISRAPL